MMNESINQSINASSSHPLPQPPYHPMGGRIGKIPYVYAGFLWISARKTMRQMKNTLEYGDLRRTKTHRPKIHTFRQLVSNRFDKSTTAKDSQWSLPCLGKPCCKGLTQIPPRLAFCRGAMGTRGSYRKALVAFWCRQGDAGHVCHVSGVVK